MMLKASPFKNYNRGRQKFEKTRNSSKSNWRRPRQKTSGESQSQIQQASEDVESAVAGMQQAQEEMSDGALQPSSDSADKALQELESALAQLREQQHAQRQQNRNLAAQQDFLRSRAEEAERLARELNSESASGDSQQQSQAGAEMQEAMQRAEQAMTQAQSQLNNGQLQQASQEQEQAELELRSALQQAQQELANAETREQSSAEDLAEQNAELADRQAQIREQTRELLQRLKDLSRKSGSQSVTRAERAMARAEQHLRENEGNEAEQAEREAEKHLEEAADEIEDEEQRYENLRQEELMYRVKAKLEELLERATVLLEGVVEIDRERGDELRVPRRLRPKISKFRDESQSIRDGNVEARDKLEQDASPTFPWMLEKNEADLDQIAEHLDGRSPETGQFTQLLIRDVAGRYVHLLKALDEELRRSREMQQEQQEQESSSPDAEGPDQPRRLVPPLAELQLLKQMEQDLLVDLKTFRAEDREYRDEFSRATRARMLERMGHSHTELTELFDRLLQREGVDLEQLNEEE